jgi:hypothetical protein
MVKILVLLLGISTSLHSYQYAGLWVGKAITGTWKSDKHPGTFSFNADHTFSCSFDRCYKIGDKPTENTGTIRITGKWYEGSDNTKPVIVIDDESGTALEFVIIPYETSDTPKEEGKKTGKREYHIEFRFIAFCGLPAECYQESIFKRIK